MSDERFAMADLTGGQMNAIVKKLGGKDGALRFLREETVIAPAVPKKLLELVATVSVPAIESFKAADHFKVDTKKAAVRIAWLGQNFQENFLGLIEDACEAADLKMSKLLESSLDAPIITELGDGHEIKLSQLFALMQKQGKSEKGALLTTGYANIAYIRDAKGNLWAVNARWGADDGGWYVEASSVEYPFRWRDGNQVLSR